MKILTIMFQVGVLFAFAQLGSVIANALHLPLPGSIVGICLVFLLLQAGILRLEWLESGADCLIAELMLFFIPSAVGVIQYQQMMLVSGLRFELVILLSTLTVMICTGVLAETIHRLGAPKEKRV
jgi:holin-like protein